MDKVIVNPEANLEEAEYLSEIIKLYKYNDFGYFISCNRGDCTNQSNQFIEFIENEISEEDTDYILNILGLKIIEGEFGELDNPELLLLDFMDLERHEYEEFIDIYGEDNIPDTHYDDYDNMLELSEMIWEYIINYTDRESDFYIMQHTWLETESGLIIDFTKEQFEKAVDGPITEDYYLY